MCVIIIAPRDKTVDKPVIERAIARNDDGWGISVQFPNGDVRVAYGTSVTGAWKKWKQFSGGTRVFHARIATSGAVDIKNLHPFDCTGPDGRRRLLFHNGTITGIPLINKNYSDTWHFAQLLKAVDTSPEFIEALGKFARLQNSRFVVMQTGEHTRWFGDGWITTPDGIHHSNGSALCDRIEVRAGRREFVGGLLEVAGTRCTTFLPGFVPDRDKGDYVFSPVATEEYRRRINARPTYGWPECGEHSYDYNRGERWDPLNKRFVPANGGGAQGSPPTPAAGPAASTSFDKRSDEERAVAAIEAAGWKGRMRGIWPSHSIDRTNAGQAYRHADENGTWWEWQDTDPGKGRGYHTKVAVDGPHPGTLLLYEPPIHGYTVVLDAATRQQVGLIKLSPTNAQPQTGGNAKDKTIASEVSITIKSGGRIVGGSNTTGDSSTQGSRAGVGGEGTASASPVNPVSTGTEILLPNGETVADWETRVAKAVAEAQGEEYTPPLSARDVDDIDALSDEEAIAVIEREMGGFKST